MPALSRKDDQVFSIQKLIDEDGDCTTVVVFSSDGFIAWARLGAWGMFAERGIGWQLHRPNGDIIGVAEDINGIARLCTNDEVGQ